MTGFAFQAEHSWLLNIECSGGRGNKYRQINEER